MRTKYLKDEVNNNVCYYYKIRRKRKNETINYNDCHINNVIIHSIWKHYNRYDISEACLRNTTNKNTIVIDRVEWNDALDKAIKYINKLR